MHKNLVFVTLLVLLVTSIVPTFAQADMMDDEKIICDSTTILLLYIVKYDYGYHSTMDVSVFEKGQYAPLFEAMMMEEMDEGDDIIMTEEAMMDDDMMSDDMMILSPLMVEDEDPACTDLRASVEGFLYKTLSNEMMMMEDEK
jgi:hypothetical protein